MHSIVLLLALLPAAATPTSDCVVPPGSEPMPGGVIVQPAETPCIVGDMVRSDDGTFENAYAWSHDGVQPPIFGGFGEGYDLGPGVVECAVLMLTTNSGLYTGQGTDVYVWSGGVDDPPGEVLLAHPGLVFGNVQFWPNVGRNEVHIGLDVEGAFTVGFWPNWPGEMHGFYCAADQNGLKAHPWTCIAPGVDFPSGWQDPSNVWGETASMGLGVRFSPRSASIDDVGFDPVPPPGPTWGSVKALFGE